MPREKALPLPPSAKQYAIVAFFPWRRRSSVMFITIFPSAARLRSGTMRLKIPVDTNSGSSFWQDMNAAILRGHDAQFREQEPCSNDGMSGELEFFLGREDAQPRERFFIRRLLHEHRLR